MAFGAPQDDDQPQYDPFAALFTRGGGGGDNQTASAAPAAPAAAPQAPVPQQAQTPATTPSLPPYIAAPDTTGTQSQQQAPQTAPAAQPQQPKIVFPSAPIAPTDQTAQQQQLEQQVSKYATPTNPSDPSVKPKWYDRLAGAMVGFGAGYRGDVAGGVRAGSAITNRRYDAAEAQREGSESSAQQNLSNFRQDQDQALRGYETQLHQYDASMQSARAQQEQQNSDRSFQQNQQNNDRNFQRDTTNDAARRGDVSFQQNRQTAEDAERVREANLTNSREGARLAEQSRHDKAIEGNDGTGAPGTPGKLLAQRNALVVEHDKEYQQAAAAEQKELDSAPASQAPAIRAKYDGVRQNLQSEWNQRYAQNDPQGRFSKGQGQTDAPTRVLTDAKGNKVTAKIDGGRWINAQTGQPL